MAAACGSLGMWEVCLQLAYHAADALKLHCECSGHASPAMSADEAEGYTPTRPHRRVAELLPETPKVRIVPQVLKPEN